MRQRQLQYAKEAMEKSKLHHAVSPRKDPAPEVQQISARHLVCTNTQ